MEPMALGSPVHSPSNNPTNFGSPFLPAYLMGEQQSTSTPRSRHVNLSQAKHSSTLPTSPQQEIPEHGFLKQNLFSNSFAQESPSFNNTKFTPAEKTGPPVQGLFDTLDTKYKYEQRDSAKNTPFQENSMYNSRNFDSSIVSTPVKTRNNEDINPNISKVGFPQMYNNDVSFNRNTSSNWVTVFGFAPTCINMIIKQFSTCGSIIDKKIPNQGNWIHLRYSCQTDAEKACSLNGKILLNSIMIGVIPHEPSEYKENLSLIEDHTKLNTSYNVRCITSPNRARPLTSQPFLSPENQSNINNSLTSPQAIPQRSTGLVTKAMEYVFGW